jgi:8-oxo-dGTP pyrophosphatase MutT (NUDIX family)
MLPPSSVVAILIHDSLVCRVTRRNSPGNFSLVGGSIDPKDSSPWAAMAREVWEEIGVTVLEAYKIFERIDPVDGLVAWCFHVTQWEGIPHQCEAGIEVSWGKPETLLTEMCSFREYNRALFEHMKLV